MQRPKSQQQQQQQSQQTPQQQLQQQMVTRSRTGERQTSSGSGPRSSGQRPSTGLRKLAPLDHIKNLYDGAAERLKGDGRKLFQKKDLVDAVREMNSNTGLNKILHSQSETALALVARPNSNNDADSGASDGGGGGASGKTGKHVGSRGKGGLDAAHGRSQSADNKKKKRAKLPVMNGINDTRVHFKSPEEILQDSLNLNSKKFNELKIAVKEREEHLNAMNDELAGLQAENDSLRRMELHQTSDTHRIDELKDRIAEAAAELEARQQRKATLLHMKKRLDVNQVAFDAHIKGMEEALVASSREFEEVKALMRQLETGNSTAQEALRTALDKATKERELRNKQLAQRRLEAANAKRMEEWREKREKARLKLDAELRGDLTEEGEQKLIDAVKKSAEQDEELDRIHQRTTQAVNTYEEAFAAIREATGVRTLDEMVEKFLGQSANKQALLEEKIEAEQRQRRIKEELATVQTEFAEFKAAGIGGSELNREMYDKLDNEILEARHDLKIKQAVNARLESILIQVRAGMQGLLSRVAPFKSMLSFDDDGPSNKSGIEVLDLTLTCEARLMKLLEIVNAQVGRQPGASLDADTTQSGSFDTFALPNAAPTPSSAGTSALARSEAGDHHAMRVRPSISLALAEPVEEATHVNNIRVRPRRLVGNGDLGTPLSTARSPAPGADGDAAGQVGDGQLLLGNGGDASERGGDSEHAGGSEPNGIAAGSNASARSGYSSDGHYYEDDGPDAEPVVDALAIKKRAKARVHKAMEEQKAMLKREQTLTTLRSKLRDRESSGF